MQTSKYVRLRMTLMYMNPDDPKEIFPYKTKNLDSPRIDELKESQFNSSIPAYSVINASVRENGEYWVEFMVQYGSRSNPIEIILNNYTDTKEVLKFLKNLHNSTFNLIQFIEKHNLLAKDKLG